MTANIHLLTCCDCGVTLGMSLQPLPEIACRCHMCMASFTKMAETFDLQHLPNHTNDYIRAHKKNCHLNSKSCGDGHSVEICTEILLGNREEYY